MQVKNLKSNKKSCKNITSYIHPMPRLKKGKDDHDIVPKANICNLSFLFMATPNPTTFSMPYCPQEPTFTIYFFIYGNIKPNNILPKKKKEHLL